MSDETLKYVPEIAKRNYAIVFGLLFVALVFSLITGTSKELTLLRLAVVPLCFLSFKGLTSIYRHPIVEHKVTLRAVEYAVLTALIASLVLVIFLWNPDQTYIEILKQFFIFLFASLVGCIVVMFLGISKASKHRSG